MAGTRMSAGQVAYFMGYIPLVIAWIYAEVLEWRRCKGIAQTQTKERSNAEEEASEASRIQVEESASLLDSSRGKAAGTPIRASLYKLVTLNDSFILENRVTLRAIAEFGSLLFYFFLCDRTGFLHSASEKTRNSDLFWFLYLLLVAASCLTSLKKHTPPATKPIAYLNRHQTEEWKGWMQVLFLMYHYFDAKEIYNAIRLFIAAYVWMTGFGNFSYYYVRKDFSFGRFCQMMWRLNFLVFFCCAILNNSYMLYYICPMHTLFTLFVYATLGIGHRFNEIPAVIAIKLILVTASVIVMWEVPGIFDLVWAPFTFLMGYQDPKHPDLPLLHEWHFRSGLDRYIWIVGMLYAYFHPMVERALERLEESEPKTRAYVKGGALLTCLAVGYVWYEHVYLLPKLEYNKYHPYTSWIPITIYIVLRNLSQTMRNWSLELFAWLGKITLETYIAQFHIWLNTGIANGQPFRLLSILDGYPMLNFLLCTGLYIMVSHRLFELTNSLKNTFMPSKDNLQLGKNMLTGTVIASSLYAAALLIVNIPLGG